MESRDIRLTDHEFDRISSKLISLVRSSEKGPLDLALEIELPVHRKTNFFLEYRFLERLIYRGEDS